MKTVIIAVNAKFIHSSLSPWYLKAYCGDECGEIKVLEFTINDSLDSALASIYFEKADIAAFSCYIWNVAYIFKLAEALKKASPHIKIILGGPEVSYDDGNPADICPWADYVVQGEGEKPFKFLLKQLGGKAGKDKGTEESGTQGLRLSVPHDIELDSIPSPYTDEMLSRLQGRIVYYESSRGCPFSCSYCLSSTFKGVRHFSMERVKSDIKKLVDAGAGQVKFVDRTFNCDKKRAKEIFRFILETAGNGPNPGINFHFEAAGDLFDDEMLDILSKAPPGLMQFEIGIQSANMDTLRAVNRVTDLGKAFSSIKRIRAMGKAHIHLDLIAGLPFEDFRSFKKSFDAVYSLKPHYLQLGFLKMLKGSKIRREAEIHGYAYREYPPYEVLCNRYITFEELIELKGIEELVERYFNSGKFAKSLEFAIAIRYDSPFDFFRRFLLFHRKKGYFERTIAARELYPLFIEFFEEETGAGKAAASEAAAPNPKTAPNGMIPHETALRVVCIFKELLKLDFLASDNSGNLPRGLEREIRPGFRERRLDFLKHSADLKRYIPQLDYLPEKQAFKKVHFELFGFDVTNINGSLAKAAEIDETVLLFNYNGRNRVTGLYDYFKIRI